jgi:hypothetical protein
MMTGALVERRSPGRRVTHESMCWVGAAQESNLVEHPRIALGHGDSLPFPVHRHLTCSLHLGVAPGAARESSRPMLDDQIQASLFVFSSPRLSEQADGCARCSELASTRPAD